jgi:hypothetical protein
VTEKASDGLADPTGGAGHRRRPPRMVRTRPTVESEPSSARYGTSVYRFGRGAATAGRERGVVGCSLWARFWCVAGACSGGGGDGGAQPDADGGGAEPSGPPVRVETIEVARPGPGPAEYNRVRVVEHGPAEAENVMVLVPGTSAGAAYFTPVALDIVDALDGWQVWAVDRRENLLEDHGMLQDGVAGNATTRETFDYYLGWLGDDTITEHFEPVGALGGDGASVDSPASGGWRSRSTTYTRWSTRRRAWAARWCWVGTRSAGRSPSPTPRGTSRPARCGQPGGHRAHRRGQRRRSGPHGRGGPSGAGRARRDRRSPILVPGVGAPHRRQDGTSDPSAGQHLNPRS